MVAAKNRLPIGQRTVTKICGNYRRNAVRASHSIVSVLPICRTYPFGWDRLVPIHRVTTTAMVVMWSFKCTEGMLLYFILLGRNYSNENKHTKSTTRKSWLLFPPDNQSSLTPTRIPYEESSVYCEENWFSPHDPKGLLQKTTNNGSLPFRIVLEPGDILIVPPRWWHYVENLDISLSINTWIPLVIIIIFFVYLFYIFHIISLVSLSMF